MISRRGWHHHRMTLWGMYLHCLQIPLPLRGKRAAYIEPFGPASKRLFFALLIILGLTLLGTAQSPAYRNYLLDDGLASSTVYGAMQDHKGYIWFATESGVSRFDGMTFKNFQVSDGLSGNDVLSVFEDRRGRIWFFPFNDHVSFCQAGQVHNIETDPWLQSVKGRNFITSFTEDREGTVWMGEDGGKIFKVHPDNCVEEVPSLAPDQSRSFIGLFCNDAGEVMACSNSFLYNLSKGTLEQSVDDSLDKFLPPRLTKVGHDSVLYAIADRLALVVDKKVTPLSVLGQPFGAEILYLLEDRNNDLWVGTRNGALHITDYTIRDSLFVILRSSVLLPGKAISSILEDQEGNVWLSSLGEGIFFFPSVYAPTYALSATGQSSFCNKVFADRQGRIWVGFDRSRSGQLIDGRLELQEPPPWEVGRGRMTSIFEDREGNIFLFSDGSVTTVSARGRTEVRKSGGKAITQLSDGTYVVSHSWEVDSVPYVPIEEFHTAYATTMHDLRVLLKKRAISLHGTRNGKLLIGTLNGLMELDGEKVNMVDAVPTFSVSGIAEGSDGTIWLSSLSKGVGYLRHGEFVAVTTQDGLASDICHGLTLASPRKVYVATNRGISCIEIMDFDRKQWRIRNFGTSSGLASEEVRCIAIAHGKLYAATASGLTVLDEATLVASPPIVPVHIEQFTVAGRSLPLDSAPFVLQHWENELSLTFTGINFRNADRLKFSYQLSEAHNVGRWIPTQARQLEFPDLRAGKYELRIRALVEGLPGTTGEAKVAFEVLPAFWETTWFLVVVILVAILLVSGLFFWIWRRTRRAERRRAEINRRIAESEQKALRAQMNPHFIFNSLNSIENFFIENRAMEANAFIADFSDLIRSILDASGKQAITLKEEMRFVELFLGLECHRMDHRFSFKVEIDPDLFADALLVPPMLVQPFAENAVWHGVSPLVERRGEILVRVTGVEQGLQIHIEDNGIGHRKSEELKRQYRQKHKSSGIRITTERLELLNMDLPASQQFSITVEEVIADAGTVAGTQVIIFIPNSFSQPES